MVSPDDKTEPRSTGARYCKTPREAYALVDPAAVKLECGYAPQPYPSDVSDKAWSFGGPDLTLMEGTAPQRGHDLREVFNALRCPVRAGAKWRLLSNDFPPCKAFYQ